MNEAIVYSNRPVLLVGGGALAKCVLSDAVKAYDTVVAADGGAVPLLDIGRVPDAVIGDMDSLPQSLRDQVPDDRVFPIAEQDSTDFSKCLRNVEAPLVLGYGFLGARLDHQLAAMTVLVSQPDRRCVLVGDDDVVMLAPPSLDLNVPVGMRLSLFPMAHVTGQSRGLRWPLDGLSFAPDAVIGTSNEVTGPVSLCFDQAAMLLILPLTALTALLTALEQAPSTWPARA